MRGTHDSHRGMMKSAPSGRHREFCQQEIGYGNDSVLEGYVSSDGYRWVCEECFSDFKEAFGFTDESKGHDGF